MDFLRLQLFYEFLPRNTPEEETIRDLCVGKQQARVYPPDKTQGSLTAGMSLE